MRGEALVAELQTELILALRAKATVALMAGADLLVMGCFVGVNFGMDFDHGLLPLTFNGQTACHVVSLKRNDLCDAGNPNCVISRTRFFEKPSGEPRAELGASHSEMFDACLTMRQKD